MSHEALEKRKKLVKTSRLTLFAVLCFGGLLPLRAETVLAQAQGAEIGYRSAQVKAAFLFRLPRFIRWSDGRQVSHFCFDESSDVMETFQRLLVGKNEVAKISLRTPGDEDTHCDVLFVAGEREVAIVPHQLLVSDREDFASSGGMIELTRQGSRVGLNINLNSLEDGKLSASSQLLKLANVLGGR